MKTEIRTVPTVVRTRYFIADDGTEFTSQRECADYELKQELGKRNIPWQPCTSIEDDRPAKIWYIKSEEEFKWLTKTEWAHAYPDGEFTIKGWYIAIFHDGGDWQDSYEIYPLDGYIEEFEKRIQELKDLTKS